jgi:hypothetical protein
MIQSANSSVVCAAFDISLFNSKWHVTSLSSSNADYHLDLIYLSSNLRNLHEYRRSEKDDKLLLTVPREWNLRCEVSEQQRLSTIYWQQYERANVQTPLACCKVNKEHSRIQIRNRTTSIKMKHEWKTQNWIIWQDHAMLSCLNTQHPYPNSQLLPLDLPAVCSRINYTSDNVIDTCRYRNWTPSSWLSAKFASIYRSYRGSHLECFGLSQLQLSLNLIA